MVTSVLSIAIFKTVDVNVTEGQKFDILITTTHIGLLKQTVWFYVTQLFRHEEVVIGGRI